MSENNKIRKKPSNNNNDRVYNFKLYEVVKLKFRSNNSKRFHCPSPRSGHRSVCSNGNIYSLGGFNPESPRVLQYGFTVRLYQELWKFNIATCRWKLILNNETVEMPTELASNAVTLDSDIIMMVYGGTAYPFGETCSNKCYVITLNDETIIRRLPTSGRVPTPQYGPAICIHNDYLYTIGGTTGFEYSCDVHRLNLHTNVWESVYLCSDNYGEQPLGRYRHEIVYTGDRIYVLGGGTALTVFELKILPSFDLNKLRWEFIKTKPHLNSYPGARKCHSCVQYNTDNGIEAVIAGGYCDEDIYYSDIWKINFNTMQWELVTAQLPHPLFFHSSALSDNNCMFLFGGIENNNDRVERTNSVYKIWIKIPTLSQMCWDAVCFYNNGLEKYSKDYLLRLGIPRHYLERIFNFR